MSSAGSPVALLSEQYVNEFNDLRQRTQRLSDAFVAQARAYQERLRDIQPVIGRERNELLATLQDQSEIRSIDRGKLLATFTWTGIILAGMTAGCIFARYILAPFISLFISEFFVTLAAYVVLPFVAFRYFTGPIEGEFKEVDQYRRHSLLALGFVEGMLTGSLFAGRYLPGMAPPSFVAPLSIAIISHFASTYIESDRRKMLACTMGATTAIYLGLGTTTGFSAGFFVLMIAYDAIVFGMMQMYLRYGDADHKLHAYQVAYMVAVVYAQAVVFTLFSVDANGLAEANK